MLLSVRFKGRQKIHLVTYDFKRSCIIGFNGFDVRTIDFSAFECIFNGFGESDETFPEHLSYVRKIHLIWKGYESLAYVCWRVVGNKIHLNYFVYSKYSDHIQLFRSRITTKTTTITKVYVFQRGFEQNIHFIRLINQFIHIILIWFPPN